MKSKFTFRDTVNFIDGLDKFGINPSLDNIQKICNLLGNPQDSFPSVHVVGTNGKTSTTRFIAKILCSLIGSFGAYISPHVRSYTERYLICEKEISDGMFSRIAAIIDEVRLGLQKRDQSIQITQFEFLTAMAFKYFQQKKVKGAVLEAGMGGRWDATNAKDSRVVVLMPVGLEHCNILGNSLGEIAGEKAGVIKDGSDVVLMATEPEVLKIVLKRCKKTSSRLFVYKKDFDIDKKRLQDGSIPVKISGTPFGEIFLEGGGSTDFQLENLLAATMASVLFLKTLPSGFNDSVKKVACSLQIPGRFEIVLRNPLIIIDGGHNPQAVDAIINELDSMKIDGKKFIIFAAFNDKDVASMLVRLAGCADYFVFTTSKNKRSFTPDELLNIYEDLIAKGVIKQKVECLVCDDIATGMREVLRLTDPADAVIVTGSISNISPAKYYLRSAGVY